MSPREVVDAWLRSFNAGDSAGIATLYAEEAVNHQVALEPVTGRAAIERFHRDVFAGGPLVCVAVNVVADAEWVAIEWADPQGVRGAGFFRVVAGLIVEQRGYWDSVALARAHPGLPGHR